jgi:hypothetical protein
MIFSNPRSGFRLTLRLQRRFCSRNKGLPSKDQGRRTVPEQGHGNERENEAQRNDLVIVETASTAKRKQSRHVQRHVLYISFLFPPLRDFLCLHKTFLCFSKSLPMLFPIHHSSKYTSNGFAVLKG